MSQMGADCPHAHLKTIRVFFHFQYKISFRDLYFPSRELAAMLDGRRIRRLVATLFTYRCAVACPQVNSASTSERAWPTACA